MHALSRLEYRQRLPQVDALEEHFGALRVVANPRHIGPHQHQVSVAAAVGSGWWRRRSVPGHVLEQVLQQPACQDDAHVRGHHVAGDDEVAVGAHVPKEPSRRPKAKLPCSPGLATSPA